MTELTITRSRTRRPCAICEIPTISMHGICTRTRECRNEYARRIHQARDDQSRSALPRLTRRQVSGQPESVFTERRRLEYMQIKEGLARRQGGICPWCTLPLPDDLSLTALDHIIPRSAGGPDEEWNYQVLHAKCNGTSGKWFYLTPGAIELAAKHGIPLEYSSVAAFLLPAGRAARAEWLRLVEEAADLAWLRTDARRSILLIASCIALYASQYEHRTRPTLARLTEVSGLSLRAVQRHLRWLEGTGLLEPIEPGVRYVA